LRLKLG